MRRIGLIGGMSWVSTGVYYRLLNERVAQSAGGLHSAPLLVWSADFAEIEALQREGRWSDAAAVLAGAARDLVAGGAEVLGIATNTMHLVADEVAAAVDVPLVHLVDATAAAALARGVNRVGLLGTSYTMEAPFYRERLASHGLEVVVPNQPDRGVVHRVIFEELCQGRVTDHARWAYMGVLEDLVGRGAQAALLACTEIGLLLRDGDAAVPLLDTTEVHVDALLAAARA